MYMRHINNVYIADTARVTGEVTLAEDVNLWFGVAIRGDVAPISVGPRTNVQDNAVIHCEYNHPLTIGADITIGHGAIVHCSSVGDGSLIGMGSTLLNGATIGKQCLIGAGAVVPQGLNVPDRHMVLGIPGRIIRPLTDAELVELATLPTRYVANAKRYHEHPDHPLNRPYA